MTLAPGSLLNQRYRILEVLGHGGMGSVYRVFDEIRNVTYALKQNLFLTDDFSEQFQREASIMASLHHHNLPKVGDFFSIPGRGQYLIMEYVEGEDLRQRIERLHKLPEGEVILIGLVICEALNYLHSRRPPIIHRDIKPGNIRITPSGEVYLVDFGLAKAKIGNEETISGARAMTPGYSPPEQYGSARTDERSDIYSLGATLYAALTGIIPCDALDRITGKSRLVKIRDLNPSVSWGLSKIIEKAMDVDADDRYQSAEEFQSALFEVGSAAIKFPYPHKVSPPPKEAEVSTTEQAENMEGKMLLRWGGLRQFSRRRSWLLTSLLIIFGVFLILLAVLLPGRPENLIGEFFKAFSSYQSVTVSPISRQTSSLVPGMTEISSSPQPIAGTMKTTEAPPSSSIPMEGTELNLAGNGVIAYSSNHNGSMQIWIMNDDGSNPRQLTFMEGGACQPAWSADGEKLVFISPCSEDQQNRERTIIYIMKADGSEIHPLIPQPETTININPVWRPGN